MAPDYPPTIEIQEPYERLTTKAQSRTITWLHLSDLHVGHPSASYDLTRIREELFYDLRKLRDGENIIPDFIFFTGDVAFGEYGSEASQTLYGQYALAYEDFFSELIDLYKEENYNSKNLFIVPGNHDVNRKKMDTSQIVKYLDEQTDHEVINSIISEGGDRYLTLTRGLEEYRRFVESYGNGITQGISTYDSERLIFAAEREVAGLKIGIVGLNSAWLCSPNGGPGKLRMGAEWQMRWAKWWQYQNGVDFSIVLSHHPPWWFARDEEQIISRDTRKYFRFLLHGHNHNGWVDEYADIRGHTRIGTTTCYRADNQKSGYNLVRIDLDKYEGAVWLRQYDDKARSWVANQNLVIANAGGKWRLVNLKTWLDPIVNTHSHPPGFPKLDLEAIRALNEQIEEVVLPNMENIVTDILVMLVKNSPAIPTRAIRLSWQDAITLINESSRKQRNEQIYRQVIHLLIEQIFDPFLNFKMQGRAILNAFGGIGVDKRYITPSHVNVIYSVTIAGLEGISSDLASQEQLTQLEYYIQQKIVDLKYSRMAWGIT